MRSYFHRKRVGLNRRIYVQVRHRTLIARKTSKKTSKMMKNLEPYAYRGMQCETALDRRFQICWVLLQLQNVDRGFVVALYRGSCAGEEKEMREFDSIEQEDYFVKFFDAR
jgi:hypothetical protein